MFKRNILVIFLVGVFALPGTLLAQETEKQRMIREIVSAGNSLDQLESMKDLLAQQMETQLAVSGVTLSAEQKEGLLAIVFEMVEELIVQMIPLAIEFYDQKFNETEVREIYAFITTPTGKKMTAAAPELALMLSQEMTPMMMEMLPGMQQKILELVTSTTSE